MKTNFTYDKQVILSWYISLHFDNWYISLNINTKMCFNRPVMGNPFAVTILSRYTSMHKMIYNFNLNLSSLLIFLSMIQFKCKDVFSKKMNISFLFSKNTFLYFFCFGSYYRNIYYHKLMGFKIRILLFCCHTFILRFV